MHRRIPSDSAEWNSVPRTLSAGYGQPMVRWPKVRAIHDAARVPGARAPYDTAHLTVHYPAADQVDDPALGIIGPDPSYGRLPVVILSGNFNCGPELYAWLAKSLAARGVAVVTYSWVSELFGGRPGLGTGVELAAVTPDGPRVAPSTLLPALLDRLDALDASGDLAGALDLGRVLLGGHSAGGTLALLAASGPWWPQVRGAFSYAGHTRAQVPQGFGADRYLPLPGTSPLLLMGGTDDGVVSAIATAQIGHVPAGHPMARTFDEAVPADRESWLVLVDGADHYSVAEGYDATTGRGYLEPAGGADPAQVRSLVGRLVADFADYALRDDTAARDRLTAACDRARPAATG